MKKFPKLILGAVLATSLCIPALSTPKTPVVPAVAATTATGYDSADDVQYITKSVGNITYIYNWGAREEDCTFLSTYAVGFNSGDYSFETLSKKAGGTSQDNAPNSELYKALQEFMISNHKTLTKYDGTKELYRYTDCVSSDTEYLSSFYLGNSYTSSWPYGGNPWNREHVWPKSKCKNSKNEKEETADIMTLRATNHSENSSRNNKAYANQATANKNSADFYDPNKNGQDIHGDCARMLLYTYTRWGTVSEVLANMWGSNGVIENLDTLLQWMEEDPVDTWEMGRNDAVQAITGTRNVFVDYPEYAWLLFGQEIPNDMVTPSGYAMKNGETDNNDNNNLTPEPEIPNDFMASLGMDCSGSVTCGLTVSSAAIGAVALLFKKKED